MNEKYETIKSMAEKAGISEKAIIYRISVLKKRGVVLMMYNLKPARYNTESADEIINYKEGPRKYPKNRKEPPKGTRPGKQKVKR